MIEFTTNITVFPVYILHVIDVTHSGNMEQHSFLLVWYFVWYFGITLCGFIIT